MLGYFIGDVDLKMLFSSVETIRGDADYDARFSLLYDIRDAKFSIDLESIQAFVERLKNHNVFPLPGKRALLTKQPNQVAFAYLVREFGQSDTDSFEVFSSVSKALQFLGARLESLDSIEATLDGMKLEL
ncbi:hypothetical protein LAG90_02495 [Marinilongibacter aquaticus]|uniref:hypothetical protein n=1 Tax=Marinilongibacter aquaticus TaxID=2975157 RepID=UPI0021BD1BB0|nr:hypothetical protein [Marinilongibacter aquaticus]UBM59524.1 hypothetical protein LAG90_02495 [Marinilongibacter aquaticus]